jgi:ubiquinol-cytochrome c reductase cytochrome b subunit
MMGTGFIGYVLPWGQMSFWGATVITSLVTAVPLVGDDVAYWIWGGFSINNATLNRFFSLHYLLPFVVTGIILAHLVILHTKGSSDPLVLPVTPLKLTFHPYFSYKDAFIFTACLTTFVALVTYWPNLLGHSDNFIPANPLVTPAHIVPEWYFTPFYAILRACPDKLGGAIGMFAAILLLLTLPLLSDLVTKTKSVLSPHSSAHYTTFWFFIGIFFTLIFLGSNPAAAPYVFCSQFFTLAYFAYKTTLASAFT